MNIDTLNSEGILDQTSLEISVENSSLDISRVSDSLEPNVSFGNSESSVSSSLKGSAFKKPSLVWDFPKSVDSGKSLINSGKLEVQGDTQNSICSKLGKIKIKGLGRPKKRKLKRHPFKIGRCKLWAKANKDPISIRRKLAS